MPLFFGHFTAGLHLVYGNLDGRAADTPQRDNTIVLGDYDDCLGWSIE